MPLETFEKLPEDKKNLIISTGIREFSLKSYKDVKTDNITEKCKISKGILFHYFGSKKEYYLYCLNRAMERLIEETVPVKSDDFYKILFESMNRKIAVCMKHKDEMHMVNMASRDASSEIAREKSEIIKKYMVYVKSQSAMTLDRAVSYLKIKSDNRQTVLNGLHIYINAVLNKYLLQYQQTPDKFFENSDTIKKEIKEYLDVMLYGVCTEEDI